MPQSSYRPQLGYETDHHSNRPNFTPQTAPSGPSGWGGEESSEEESEVVNSSASPGEKQEIVGLNPIHGDH